MKRVLLAIFCCASFLGNPLPARADAVFDQDMASRYLRAAQSGDDDAQFYLGALYSAGIGVPRSDEEAFRWISRAAAQGHSHAMLILSGLYAVGRGVQKDNVQAYKWAYLVNGASRIEEFRNGSRQLLSVLEGRMSRDEINYAKSDAGRWRPVVNARPAQAPVPPVQRAPPPVATATPAPAASQPPAKSTSNADLDRNIRKGDVDAILDQVPQELRKKFGF